MILGIVGSEAAKFTESGEREAKRIIWDLVEMLKPEKVSSGDCHLGGIDVWAEEIADILGVETKIFPPKSRSWTHYKARNIQIAEFSHTVICLSVDRLPSSYTGMRFPLCYHCVGLEEPDHIKSGGCWTTKYARSIGREGRLIVVNNAE